MENKIFLTSDFHFQHNKEFIYKSRGFNSVEEMNEILIENYNKIIPTNAEVYILGDCVLGGANKLESGAELIKRLHGHLHIVRGNHCTDKRIDMYKTLSNVIEIENSIYLKYEGYHFYLSHYPSMTSNYDDNKGLKHRTLNLCGHTHTPDRWLHWATGSYHCEVDAHNNNPVLLDDIIQEMKEYSKQFKALLPEYLYNFPQPNDDRSTLDRLIYNDS